VRDRFGTAATALSNSGLKELVDISVKVLPKNPPIGYFSVLSYNQLLLDGYYYGLAGQAIRNQNDLEAMSFLGLDDVPEELIAASPAAFSIVSKPYKASFVVKADATDFRKALKYGRTEELDKLALTAQRSLKSQNLYQFAEDSRKIQEIVTEQLSTETAILYPTFRASHPNNRELAYG
jgi:hypothetical protein